MKSFAKLFCAFAFCSVFALAQQVEDEYKLLATKRTSTMEKEINEAADAGYRLVGTMGGEMKGGEIITIMRRSGDGNDKGRFQYKVLATSRTSTMQKELQSAADEGYEYRGYTARGEVLVILELDHSIKNHAKYEYKLLATSKTSTTQKELNEATEQGYEFVGIVRRGEVITFLRKKLAS
jgi:hypothetical protein